MSSKDLDKIGKVGRRRFLNIMGAAGVSATSLHHMTQEAVAKGDFDLAKEVPFVSRIERKEDSNGNLVHIPHYDSIERERWTRIHAAGSASRALSNSISKQFDDTSGIKVWVEAVSKNKNNHFEWVTNVEYSDRVSKEFNSSKGSTEENIIEPTVDENDLEDFLPSATNGLVKSNGKTERREVPVRFSKEKLHRTYYEDNYRPVPGGAKAEAWYTSTLFDRFTLGTSAHRKSNLDRVMLTCGHVFGTGADDVHQPGLDNMIGHLESMKFDDEYYDMALINPNSGTDLNDRFAEDDGTYTSDRISGIRTYDWIVNKGYGETVYRRGWKTDLRSGTVSKWGNAVGQKEFASTANCAGGDSGGPHYTDNGSDFSIVGIQAFGWGGSDGNEIAKSGGNSAEIFEEDFDVYIY